MLAGVIAGLIGDVRHVAVGNASPIPATAALLARERGGGRPYVSLLQSRKHNFFTAGGCELFDCAGQGRIDVFFLSGGQIGGDGSDQSRQHRRARPSVGAFPGSFGSGYLYYVVPKVILFRLEHSRRTLVPKVDFVSAPGTSPDNVYRTGGPIALVTNRCVFAFDKAKRPLPARQRASRPHAWKKCATKPDSISICRPKVRETPAPDADTLRLMRERVAPELAEVYPEFTAKIFNIRH